MSDDKTLYSQQNSKEIDEALAWLESLGDSAATRRSTRRSEPTAFMRLPAWLRQDIRLELPEPVVPNSADPKEDNLSWLEAIASGVGGGAEEPPTMQWADSYVDQNVDDATELMSPDDDDFDMDAPTHISMKRPAVDTEITTTLIPSSRKDVTDDFEPTNIIPELSDEAMALVNDEAALEPTSLIFPEDVDQPFDFADLLDEPTQLLNDDADLEPTSLIIPESDVTQEPVDEQPVDEHASLMPPLPPIFEPIDPFEPTELITDSDEPLFEPTNFAPPSDELDEPTHLLQPEPDLDEIETAAPERIDSEVLDELSEPESLVFPDLDEIEPTELYEPTSNALLDDAITVDNLADFEPTELYLPSDAELESLVETNPFAETPPAVDPFDEFPTELIFDDFAAMAAEPPESTELIQPENELPAFDFPDLTEATEIIEPDAAAELPVDELSEYADEPPAFDFPDLTEATEIIEPHTLDTAAELPIEGLSDYADEPTEPSLFRPELDAALAEATQYFETQGKSANNLFEPTIVSEISIAERWQAIPTELRPRRKDQSFADAPVADVDEQPTETISEVLHIADDIPDDPDETIAWLEEMARQQKLGIPPAHSAPAAPVDVPEVVKTPDPVVDELPTILAEPEIEVPSSDFAEVPDVADSVEEPVGNSIADEQLPASFFDDVDEVSPTIIAEVGQSADDGMDAFVREVSDLLDDESEPLASLNTDAEPDGESEEELTDALAWLEELVTGTDSSIDEMTIELNETDVNRLLDSYQPSEFAQQPPDMSDHPTLITQHPSVNKSKPEAPDDLDAALSWLEGLNFDEESSIIEPPTAVSRVEAPVTLIDYSAALNSARHAFQTQSYAEAIVIFEDLLQREDRNATDLVIEDLIEWTGKVPDHAPFFRLLGDAYLQRGDYEKAAWTFRRGLTI